MPALILSMILWGTLGVFVLWSGLPALEIAFYRCLIGVIFIGPWLFKSKAKIALDKNTGIAALAGAALVMNWVFLFKSFQVSTITIGNMSYYLQPIILIVLGIILYKEKVSLQQWLWILMAVGGVLLTVDIRNLHSPHIVLGIFYALFAALLYSFLTILMKPINMDFFKVIFIQLLTGVVILWPFVNFSKLGITPLGCLLIIGVIHTLLAYFLYYKAIKITSFTQIAIISYLDPVVAIATDVIFFNRQLSLCQVIGVSLAFLALYSLMTAKPAQNLAPLST